MEHVVNFILYNLLQTFTIKKLFVILDETRQQIFIFIGFSNLLRVDRRVIGRVTIFIPRFSTGFCYANTDSEPSVQRTVQVTKFLFVRAC